MAAFAGAENFNQSIGRIMQNLLGRSATPLITGLFIVSLVSGIALFFHVGPGGVHAMHEWLSMVLIVPFILHLWKNWRPMTGYFRRPAMAVALALSAAAAGAFLIPTGQSGVSGGRPPQFALAQRVLAGSVEDVAPLLGMSADEMVAMLKASGFDGASANAALTEIASAAGRSETEIAALIAGEAGSPGR